MSDQGTLNWGITTVPQFTGKKAFCMNAAFYGDIVNYVAMMGFSRANTVEEADIVVFGGGADIDPRLYGEERLPCTHWNSDRDTIEQFHYNKAKRLGVPMFGICRGAQFLWAMNGGKLWQDVNNHAGTRHNIIDLDEDVRVMANSYHHQMLQMTAEVENRATIIAVCEDQVATRFTDASIILDLKRDGANAQHEMEIEAACFHDTGCFFVQGHPEVGTPEFQSWTAHKLEVFLQEFEQQKELALELSVTVQ